MTGIYTKDENGTIILTGVEESEDPYSLVIKKGCEKLSGNVFSGFPKLKTIFIPDSVRVIPDGTLSNGGGWASDEKGIEEIVLDAGNPYFSLSDGLFCQKKEDQKFKLLRYIGKSEHVSIPECVDEIGDKALCGRIILDVYLEKTGCRIWFPKSHLYYLDILLSDFGRNGCLYDFTRYDRFLLENHFNNERLRMICERITKHPDITKEQRAVFTGHLRENEEDLFESLIKNGNTDILELISETGFFTEENIDRCIERLNQSDRKDLLSWLINYKHRSFTNIEFDFEI